MAIDKVRLEIPPDLGGGWVEVRERRGWAARNRLISAGVTYREGVTESDLASARTGGEVGSYIEPDTAGKAVVLVETGIAAISPEVLARHGVSTLHALLKSDDLATDLGDWLFQRVFEICDADVRSKSGLGGPEPDAGRGDGGDEGTGLPAE